MRATRIGRLSRASLTAGAVMRANSASNSMANFAAPSLAPCKHEAVRQQVWCKVPMTIRWQCGNPQCLSVNIANRGTCLRCGERRPELDGWNCPRCKQRNGNRVKVCRGCASGFVMPKTWSCPACKGENQADPTNPKCSNCDFSCRPEAQNVVAPEQKERKVTPHVKAVSVEDAMQRAEQLRLKQKELDEQEALAAGPGTAGAADGSGGEQTLKMESSDGWGSEGSGGDSSNAWGSEAASTPTQAADDGWGNTDTQSTEQAWGSEATGGDSGAAEWNTEPAAASTDAWGSGAEEGGEPKKEVDPIATKPPRSIDEFPDRIVFEGTEAPPEREQDPMQILRKVDASAAASSQPAPVSPDVDLGPPGFDWMCRNVTCGTVNDGATDTCRACLTKISPSNWICEMCSAINFKLRAACFTCKTSIPLSWQCSACHKKTSVYDVVCRNCNAERPKIKATLGPGGVPLQARLKPKVSKIARLDWVCLQCHKSNYSRRDTCVNCEAPRPTAESLGGSADGSGHTYAVPIGDNNWTCRGCKATNFRTRSDCWQCGAASPDGAASSGVDDATTSPMIDSEGFQQEVERTESDEDRNKKWVSEWSTGEGQSKIGNDAEWICAKCMHRNFKENTDCHKCFTPKTVAEVSPLIHKAEKKVKVHKI